MSDKKFIVNSSRSLEDFVSKVYEMYGSGTYLVFTWSTGRKSTMPQKALVHIWIRKYAAHLLRKKEKDVTKTEMATMKRAAKTHFYNETHESWAVEEISDPFHPDSKRMEVTSIADWAPDQCYHFMTWLQDRALMQNDLILESIGEHKNMTNGMTR